MIGLCRANCLWATSFFRRCIIPAEAHCQANHGINAVGLRKLTKYCDSFRFLELFCVYFYWDGTIEIRQLLIDTLSLFFEDRNNEFFEQIPFWLMDSYKQIQKPENFVKGIDRMIELSGKSPEHLSRSLKKYYNISPSQLISNLKLNYD